MFQDKSTLSSTLILTHLHGLLQNDTESYTAMSSQDHDDSKRRKLDIAQPVARESRPTNGSPSSRPPPSQSARFDAQSSDLSPPILYHMATSAHTSSQEHLQQAFIPPHVAYDAQAGYDPILASSSSRQSYRPDRQAATRSFALLLFALDLLDLGLKDLGLSDQERVAFTLEFTSVAMKVVLAWRLEDIRRTFLQFQVDNLLSDAAELVDSSVSFPQVRALTIKLVIAKQQKHLRAKSLQLELLSIRLAFLQVRSKIGRSDLLRGVPSRHDDSHAMPCCDVIRGCFAGPG